MLMSLVKKGDTAGLEAWFAMRDAAPARVVQQLRLVSAFQKRVRLVDLAIVLEHCQSVAK